MGNFKFYAQIPEAAYRAQELFFQLGYVWHDTKCQTPMTFDKPCWYSSFEDGDLTCDKTDVNHAHLEVTLQKLQEMVVLKRNDVKDANVTDGTHFSLYQASDNRLYFYAESANEWIISDLSGDEKTLAKLKPINQNQDQGLISGAEALRALADGKSIEWQDDNGIWWPLGVGWTWNQIVNSLNGIQALRLKPQTIKLELEIPAPFEPKTGEMYWFISPFFSTGYDHCTFSNDIADKLHIQYGAWRLEEEMKQVAAAWRKGIKVLNNA
ncbi:hypothetical protein [Acinetobacter pittii]|uniref:Uncharacterized protein n=1 Tax=Acinetobacter pittii TaxID=48296 RepID=A0A3R9S3L2_ACIPI|nr:hypothetical protein [Acinetobacter pittii]HEM6651493.1 hypothetical protein [Acinetobacter baumannii]KQE11488.1 hypothetical protein APD36_17475 [Acinetobacter pittii]KRI47702.1 hypothetical protein APC42_10120 [Acinetobacter pittii]RSO51577.1 hypothetical protein EA758_14840 [Acinetobacter pittii]RSO57845.1 hypothetical protein EA752_14595 [Acinetobacter pittii]